MKNLDSDLTEDSIGEETGGDGVLLDVASFAGLFSHRSMALAG